MPSPTVKPLAPRVLIVDDSRIVRAAIIKHIKGRFEVVEAVDGEQGWAALSGDASVRVVISDLGMPVLDGYGLLQRMRASADPRIRTMPVIMISGDDENEQRERASRLGATDFITKGVGAVELVARLDALAELAQVRQQLDTARVAVAQHATTDPLTQLGTLSLLVKQGASMFSYAQRHRLPLAVVRVGLDRFDGLRAKIGDAVADQIVVAVARLIASRMRKEDVIARADVAEFAIAAPSTTSEAAAKFSGRLVEEIRGAKITWQGRRLKITASVGIADSSIDPSESFADVFSVAGRRLDRARAQQGDRVVAADEAVDTSQAAGKAKAPDIDQALAMLAGGRGDDLLPFARELALRVYPLVQFCDEQFSVHDHEKLELTATQRMRALKRKKAEPGSTE